MRRVLPLVLVVACLGAALPARAHTCGRNPLSAFQLADRADEIALVDGTSGTVSVIRVVKGTGNIWTALPEGERPRPTSAEAPPRPPPPPPAKGQRRRRVIVLEEPGCRWDSLHDDVGSRVLAFATTDGWSAHPGDRSVLELPAGDEERDVLEAITWWLAHPDRAERRRRLLDLARRTDRLGTWAAMHFRAAPELLHAMTRTESVELVAAIAAKLPQRDVAIGVMLLQVLARLHVPEGIPPIVDVAFSAQRDAYDDAYPIYEALERLVGGDLYEALGRSRDPAVWMRWLAERSYATRAELLRASFERLGVTGAVDPDDPAALARIIREGPNRNARSFALDLCEIAIGAGIDVDMTPARWPYPGVGSAFVDGGPTEDSGWPVLATRCGAGAP